MSTAMITVDEIAAATGLAPDEVRTIMVSEDPGVRRLVNSILTTIENRKLPFPSLPVSANRP